MTRADESIRRRALIVVQGSYADYLRNMTYAYFHPASFRSQLWLAAARQSRYRAETAAFILCGWYA